MTYEYIFIIYKRHKVYNLIFVIIGNSRLGQKFDFNLNKYIPEVCEVLASSGEYDGDFLPVLLEPHLHNVTPTNENEPCPCLVQSAGV
jgi:hypothetical protein